MNPYRHLTDRQLQRGYRKNVRRADSYLKDGYFSAARAYLNEAEKYAEVLDARREENA